MDRKKSWNSDMLMRSLIKQSRDKNSEIAGLAYMVCILTRRHVWARNDSHSFSPLDWLYRQASNYVV